MTKQTARAMVLCFMAVVAMGLVTAVLVFRLPQQDPIFPGEAGGKGGSLSSEGVQGVDGSSSRENAWLESVVKDWQSADPDVRWQARQRLLFGAIVKIGPRDGGYLDFFHDQLDSEDVAEREAAIFALGFLLQRSSVPRLIPFLSDDSPFLRDKAVFALSRYRAEHIYRKIAPLLDDPAPMVRLRAAHVLKGRVADEAARAKIEKITQR